MNSNSFRHTLLLLAATVGSLPGLGGIIPLDAPLRVPPGGPHPENWFEHSTLRQQQELRRLSSSRATQAQELADLLLQGDEDAYCELAIHTKENKESVSQLYSRANEEQRARLAPLRAYHQLTPQRPSFRDLERFGEPRSHVVLLLRDVFLLNKPEAKREALHRILEQERDLHRVELAFIATALKQWCGITRDELVERRMVQSFILEYAGGHPVTTDTEMECNIMYSYPYLYDFLLAAAGVNNESYYRLKTPAELMWRYLWRYPEQSIQLATELGELRLTLLRMDSAALTAYAESLAQRGSKAPATLPQAAEPNLRLRFMMEQAANIADCPELDTSPAGRTVQSLMAKTSDPERAARLRRDALLLALIRHRTEPQYLHAYVDDLLEHGDKDELALAQRVSLWCKALPDYARLAARYEQLECWAEAAFCHEALLTLAPYTPTPFGEEQAAFHRQQLTHCREQAAQQNATRQPAAPKPQVASPFRAESRDWKLKDGSTVPGELCAIYPTLGEIALRRADGSMQRLPLKQLADNHDAYFAQWRADNGIRHWHWRQGIGCYRGEQRGKLIATYADLERPGDYHFTAMDENLTISRGQSWGLEPEERALVAEHFRQYGSARPCGEPLLAANLAEAKKLAAEKKLPIVFFFTDALQATGTLYQAAEELENHLHLHPEDAALWRESMVILPIFLSTAKGYPANYDDEQLEELRAYERELCPGIDREHSLITAASKRENNRRCGPVWVCPARGLIHMGELPLLLPQTAPPAASNSSTPEL